MSDEELENVDAGDGSQEPLEEIEIDCIVLQSVSRVQCTECGTVFNIHYKRAAGDVDPDELPEGISECPTCTKNNGVRTVGTCIFAAGQQAAEVEEALELAAGDEEAPIADLVEEPAE